MHQLESPKERIYPNHSAATARDDSDPGVFIPDGAFLTWEQHRRTRGIAHHLGLHLHEIEIPGSRLRRYWRQIRRTYSWLRRQKSKILFVQNPSLILTIFVLCWRALSRRNCLVIMDAHNVAVTPAPRSSVILRGLGRWAIRNANFTIVTNRFLAETISATGGRPLVLADPVPTVANVPVPEVNPNGLLKVLVISTYAADEPIAEILSAANKLIGRVELLFTGNFRKLDPKLLALAPHNVKFLGFLSEDAYWAQMTQAHAVLDLTLREDCLVCGAYEAVALGRPIVISDTRASREHFRAGAVYSAPNADAIATAVCLLRSEYPKLADEILDLRNTLRMDWRSEASAVASTILGALR